jgi:hypothetical protein
MKLEHVLRYDDFIKEGLVTLDGIKHNRFYRQYFDANPSNLNDFFARIMPGQKIQYIGSGEEGMAFEWLDGPTELAPEFFAPGSFYGNEQINRGGNKIIKMVHFDNLFGAEEAIDATESGDNFGFVDHYWKKTHRGIIGLVCMEKIQPLNKEEIRVFDYIADWCDKQDIPPEDITDIQYSQLISKLYEPDNNLTHVTSKNDVRKINRTVFEKVFKAYRKLYKTIAYEFSGDAHGENAGWKEDEMLLFDLHYEPSE